MTHLSDENTGGGATGAPIDHPLWLFGTEGAQEWLVPGRNRELVPLAVLDFSDSAGYRGKGGRAMTVDSLHFLLAEIFLFETDLPVSAVAFIDTDARKVVNFTHDMLTLEQIAPFLETQEQTPILAWGMAGEDLQDDGVEVRLRTPHDGRERFLRVPLDELGDTLVDWMVRKRCCRRIDPPSWYRRPGSDVLGGYAGALDNLLLQVVADGKNGLIDPHDAGTHNRMADGALDLAAARPGAAAQLELVALATCLYARRAGVLDEVNRERAMELLQQPRPDDHPVRKLAPLWMFELGRKLEALSLSMELARRAQGPYARWLAGLDQKA